MSEYRYKLNGGSRKWTCPRCGHKTFTPYIDTWSGEPLSLQVGRCDRENNCGYHKTPRDWFDEQRAMGKIINDDLMAGRVVEAPPQPKKICVLNPQYVEWTRRKGEPCDLEAFLCSLFPAEKVVKVFDEYRVGRTKDGPQTRCGDIIYWQISFDNQCRDGKIMRYDPRTGHRIKEGKMSFNWIHSIQKSEGKLPQGWELTQCFFGEHLLAKHPDKPVGIVESEKTALVCAIVYPNYVWLATGGCNGLNAGKCGHLRGRKVTIYPDGDMVAKWTEKEAEIRAAGVVDIRISTAHLQGLTDEQRNAGYDLADHIIEMAQRGKRLNGGEPPPECSPALVPLSIIFGDNIDLARSVVEQLDPVPVYNPAIRPMINYSSTNK